MSEDREPREERARPPEHVHLYIAPGHDTVSFAEMLLGAGIRRDLGEMLENMNQQITSLQEQINELQQRMPAAEHPEPEPEPEPAPQRQPMPPRGSVGPGPRRPHR